MKVERRARRLYSRREFLKAVPLGVAGAVALAVASGKLFSSALGRRSQSSDLPEDSIFRPAKVRYPKA